MPKTRREFSPEFKREAVALLESSGRPLMQVATEVGYFAIDVAKLASSGWWGYGSIKGGHAGHLADVVASGPGVGDDAVET